MSNMTNHDEIYEEWKNRSKAEMKNKMENNYVKRAKKCVKIINDAIPRYFPNITIPIFQLSQSAITNTLQQLFSKVDRWPGVDIAATRKELTTYKEYNKRADNYWNRYKAQWIGDHFFAVFFSRDLIEYILSITHNNCTLCVQQIHQTSNEQNHELLLLFMIIEEIMHSQVKFTRSKVQPLILDQCFPKSPLLHKYFKEIGSKHSVEWVVPPNDTDTKKYRDRVRQSAQQWIRKLIEQKKLKCNINNIEWNNKCDHQYEYEGNNNMKANIQLKQPPNYQYIDNNIYKQPVIDHSVHINNNAMISAQFGQNQCHCAHRCSSCHGVITSQPPDIQHHSMNIQYDDNRTQYTHDSGNSTPIPVQSLRWKPYGSDYQYIPSTPNQPQFNHFDTTYTPIQSSFVNQSYGPTTSRSFNNYQYETDIYPNSMVNDTNISYNNVQFINTGLYSEPINPNNGNNGDNINNDYNDYNDINLTVPMVDNNNMMEDILTVPQTVFDDVERNNVFVNPMYHNNLHSVNGSLYN